MNTTSKLMKKFVSAILCLGLIFQQTGFAQITGNIDLSAVVTGISTSIAVDKYHPMHLRYFSYDLSKDNFELLLDKGDAKNAGQAELTGSTQTLFDYFLIGVTLPNDKFWVNLRPDAEDKIIDSELEKTDIGKILLSADVQLKKDTAAFTSPQTSEGRQYWNKLYQKAEELYGSTPSSIPTITRPWIVPGEVIVRYTKNSAYVYKATLKVMLEQDYLKDSSAYNFTDPRAKELNDYSSRLIRELIIPQLTKEINTSSRYAELRQAYYSLILAQWFKSNFNTGNSSYTKMIDTGDLNNLTSKESWSKTAYFNEYCGSFKNGEYNIQEAVAGIGGQAIRMYVSGGLNLGNIPITGTAAGFLGRMTTSISSFFSNLASFFRVKIDSSKTVTAKYPDTILDSRGWEGDPNDSYTPDVKEALKRALTEPYSAFTRVFDDEDLIKQLEDHVLLVQAGVDWRNGTPILSRAAALTNWMWTDLLRNEDVIGLALHQEKLQLTAEGIEAIMRGDYEAARKLAARYVEIRDTLCKRWFKLALAARNKAKVDPDNANAALPSYAHEYAQKMFKNSDYKLLLDLYAEHGDNIINISPYTLDPIGALIRDGLKEGIIFMPLGAGGPGTNLAAISEKGIGHIADFLEKRGIHEVNEKNARKIVRGTKGRIRNWVADKFILPLLPANSSLAKYIRWLGTYTLKNYVPFKVGREGMRMPGFDILEQRGLLNLPEGPLDAVLDQRTGEVRELNPGETIDPKDLNLIKGKWFKPRHNFKQGESILKDNWIKEQILENMLKKAKDRGMSPDLGDSFSEESLKNLSFQQAQDILQYAIDNNINLEFIAPLRGLDVFGTSLDLPEFQLDLTPEGARLVMQFPSTLTVASEYLVKINIKKAREKYKDAVVYTAPDFKIFKRRPRVLREGDLDRTMKLHSDPKKAAAGIMTFSQPDAPAYIFMKLFGIKGVEITCQAVHPNGRAGGMESSNVFNTALITMASMLSGANLNQAEIFNLAVKLENDELNGLTGGQGHICCMIGGIAHHIWRSGFRGGKNQFAAFRMGEKAMERASFLRNTVQYGAWLIPEETIQIEQQMDVSEEQIASFNNAVSSLLQNNLLTKEQIKELSFLFVNFNEGKTAHYSVGRPQIYLDFSLLEKDKELALMQRIWHEVMEREDVLNGLKTRGLFAELTSTAINPQARSEKLAQAISELSKDSHDRLQREIPDILKGNDDSSPTDTTGKDPKDPTDPSSSETYLSLDDAGFTQSSKTQERPSGEIPNSIPATATAPFDKGGIDFRAIQIIGQMVNNTSLKINLPSTDILAKMDISAEGKSLADMMRAGIIPSAKRVMEYVAACSLNRSTESKNTALLCLTDFCRMNEDMGIETMNPEFKTFLFMIDGNSPKEDLKLAA